ncbi:GFA family protein [Pantoea ananatis]|uniref:GFA family protein n=1 Tax=Pantoea ananas TaxID=553 RepID=UPI0007633251|nr:GFA family protein [Pantoea ananatis]AMB77208.1 aldehyde-activating protein [Pantoea ananatis]
MTTFTGRCLCGECQFAVKINELNVHACHCTLCQKWSGGIAMYMEAASAPALLRQSASPSCFTSSLQGKRYFCPGCGSPMWLLLTDSQRYFIPWTQLDLTEDVQRRLVLAAEIYTETQPAFWRLTGQYARFSGKAFEARKPHR